MEILYQADLTGRAPAEVLAEWRTGGIDIEPYAAELVRGVQEGQDAIDRVLSASAEGWTVSRMATVDRTILRVACYEIAAGVPVPVAINEAIEGVRELSTEGSARFVNGVLGRAARELLPGSGPRTGTRPGASG